MAKSEVTGGGCRGQKPNIPQKPLFSTFWTMGIICKQKKFFFEKSPPKLKRELKTIVVPTRIFLLALSIPTFSFPIEWRWFHQNRSILKIAAKIEGGVPKHTCTQKKFFWVKKKALIETRILVPHMPT